MKDEVARIFVLGVVWWFEGDDEAATWAIAYAARLAKKVALLNAPGGVA